MYFIERAVKNVHPTTIGPARRRIYPIYTFTIWKSVLKADSNINAGKKRSSISCAFISLQLCIPSPKIPMPS